jgi:hypothetical protein
VLAWTAFAFGGVYASTLAVPALACIALAVAYRPAILSHGPAPVLDRLLLVALAAALLQLLPLPRTIVSWLSPGAVDMDRVLHLAPSAGALSLSVDIRDSAAAVLLFGFVLLFFFTARQVFDTGGVRAIVRVVAIAGLALSAIAIAQDATGRGLMYWRWRPPDEGPAPFGPFLNRNHFSTWAIMAVPLCLGYLTAHASAHPGPGPLASWRRKVTSVLDGRAGLLLAASAILLIAVAVSLSRSGLVGMAAALLAGGELARRHGAGTLSRSARPVMLTAVVCGLAIVGIAARVGPAAVVERFARADIAMADRVTIWRDAIPVFEGFWLTGTGVGTYQTAMAVHQRSPGPLFNQAHNHFIQVATEGGLLILVPAFSALVAFGMLAWTRLRSDRSGMYWLRAGAASGLCGVAVQSLWETGLTVPANAALAAVLAAIILHVPARFGPPRMR